MKTLHKRILLTICFLGTTIGVAFSQPPGGPPDDEDQIPLDGGISLLAGAGILYGIKSMYSKNRNKEY